MPGSIPNVEDLEAVLAALPDVVLLIDEDHVIRFVNRIETEHRPEDVIGQPAVSVLAENARDATTAALDRAFVTMEPVSQLTEVVDDEGVSSWFEGSIIPIVRDGHAHSVIVVTKNVTQRVVAESELVQLHRLLPVCAWCKKVRGESGEWRTLEAYVEESSQRHVTHGMCPECEQELDVEPDVASA